MKNLLYIAITLFILIAGCNKKDDPEPEPEPAATTGSSTGRPPVTTSVSAILSVSNSTFEIAGFGTMENQQVRAYFSSVPTTGENSSTAVAAGKVTFNGDSLTFLTQNSSYYKDFIVQPTTFNWTVAGANGIPAMNLSHPGAFPVSSDIYAMPDTLQLSKDITIEIKNVANVNEGQFVITRDDFSLTGFIYRNIKDGNNTITITSAQLKAFGTNKLMYSVMLLNKFETEVNGKRIRLNLEKTALKYITLVD